MPIAGEYSWKETSTHCHVRVLLRGANPKAVDVYASDTYVKISYAPRLIELDLVQEIDDDGVNTQNLYISELAREHLRRGCEAVGIIPIEEM